MRFGIGFANTGPFATAEGAATLGRAAEAAGFDSLWTVEHVLYPEGYESEYPYDPSGKMPGTSEHPIPDPFIWLAFVSAATERIRLATGISLLPERHPILYAKEAATLDHLSGGRLTLGIGIGWLKEEFAALGIPWERRTHRTEEYAAVLRELWSGDDVSFDGEFVQFERVTTNPKPAQASVPIHIGGHSRGAAERAGRIGDGFFPAKGDLPELLDVMRQTASDHGRDPGAIEVTGSHPGVFGDDPSAAIEELTDLGVHRVMVPSFMFWRDTEASVAAWGEKLAPYAD